MNKKTKCQQKHSKLARELGKKPRGQGKPWFVLGTRQFKMFGGLGISCPSNHASFEHQNKYKQGYPEGIEGGWVET